MKYDFRATEPADLAEIAILLRQAFQASADAPFLSRELLEWKFFARRQDWAGPRSYVLEKEGHIVAHVGLWPMSLQGAAGQELRGAQMIDWAAAKDSPGSGLSLVRKITGMFDFLYSIGGSEATQKVLPAVGLKIHSEVWRGALPLRPVRQIANHQYRNWKLAPRLVRNWKWSQGARRPLPKYQFRQIVPSEVCAGKTPLCPATVLSSPRSGGFFDFLERCPKFAGKVYELTCEGAQAGYFFLGLLRGQARLGGVWLSRGTREDYEGAYACAVRAARQIHSANEFVAMGGEGEARAAAEAAGLKMVGNTRVFLLNRTTGEPFGPKFQLQLADDDRIFNDMGSSEYWT